MTRTQINILIFILSISMSWGQQYEFGLSIGGGNYIGDIGREVYFMPNNVGGGLLFKNISNPWIGVRMNLEYMAITANDKESFSLGRQKRGLMINGDLLNFSAGIEYNFLPRNPYIRSKNYQRNTPYMYSGIGLASYYGSIYNNNTESNYSGSSFFVPMILGIKRKISEHIIIAGEISARYYFSDNLDGTDFFYNPEENENIHRIFSTNPHSNDWYTFTSFSIIYTFGDLLCYFNM